MAYTIAPYKFAKHSGMIKIRTGGTDANPTWSDLPDPMTMEYSVYDLDSEDGAGRDQDGTMFRDRRAVKEKLTCTFPPMVGADLTRMLQLVTEPFFIARFYSPYTGAYRTAEMYVGDRTSPAYVKYDALNPADNWYQATTMNLIER